MLNRENIIDILHKYNFNINNYIVISGAAMVLLGYKEKTNDIDIAVTKEYYDYLLSHYNCTLERINEFNHKVYFIGGIINFSVDYYCNNYIMKNGIPIQKSEDIITLKQFLNREKDFKDIELIKRKIKKYPH